MFDMNVNLHYIRGDAKSGTAGENSPSRIVVSLYALIFPDSSLSYTLLYNYIQFPRSIQIQIQSFFLIKPKKKSRTRKVQLPFASL